MTIGIYFRGRPAIDGERFRSIFLRAMEATGSPNRAERWDCLREERQCHVIVWGQESLDCHTYFDVLHLTLEPPPGFALTSVGRLLEGGGVSTMFVESSPEFSLSDIEYRRVTLAVAEILTPQAVAVLDWFSRRIVPVTAETPALLRGPDPRRAFDGGLVLKPPTWAQQRP